MTWDGIFGRLWHTDETRANRSLGCLTVQKFWYRLDVLSFECYLSSFIVEDFMGVIARRSLQIALYVLFYLVVSSAPVWAQGFTASVFGNVTDNTGAVIPGVTITVTNTGT